MLIPQVNPGDSHDASLLEWQAASTASGGTALTTTAAFVLLPDGTEEVELIARNIAGGGAVAKVALSPYLAVLKTTDLLVATANATDYSKAAQNATTADVVLSSLGALAANDAIYVGSHLPFRGVKVDMTAANGDASVLAVTYWDGSAWTDIAPTDGTAAAGATFGQDGNVTWTVPTDWAKAKLTDAVAGAHPGIPLAGENLYWTRWVVSVALDASTTIASMIAMNRATTYAEMIATFNRRFRCFKGLGGIAAIEGAADGTANLIVNAGVRLGSAGLG